MMLHDTFKKVEVVTEWSNASLHTSCYLCYKRDVPTCLTEKGRLCIDCVVSNLKKMTVDNNLRELTFPQIIHILGSAGNVRWRLMLLWRFKEVFEIISRESPADVDALITALVYNLECIHQHPLANAIYQAAVEACISLGKQILPTLLQMCKPEPWESYDHIIFACFSIAPDDERVQNLIQKAAYHSNPIVRKNVINIIANHNYIWGEKVLKYLANDQKKEVSTFAERVMSSLNLLNLRRITISQGITKYEFANIERTVESCYTVDTLKKIYKQYLKHLLNEKTMPQKKFDLVCALSIVFANKGLFEGLLSSLPEDVKKILNILVWEGGKHSIEKFEKMFGVQIVEGSRYHDMIFHDAYLLFQIDDMYNKKLGSLYLSDKIRKIIKGYLPRPEGYDLVPLDTIKKTDFIYVDNSMILKQLALFIAYIKQGNAKFNKNQTKVTKSSVKIMTRCCHIQEFYDNKELGCIKTQLIIDFLTAANLEAINDPIDSVKQLFDNFFKYKDLKNYRLYELLSHIKGDAFYYSNHHEQHEETVRMSFFNLLMSMAGYHWYCVENVIKHCLYNDIYLDIVEKNIAARCLYYTKKGKYGYDRCEISESLYNDAVVIPLIKSAMFLFSAFGLVDIAYNLPENPLLQDKEYKYLSVFDGLQYVRLTKLGAYVLGLIKEYKIEGLGEQKANLILDQGRLLIHMEGEDLIKRLAIEKIGERMSNAHYRVDCNSFLKECFCEKDIQQKVILFNEYISSKPPQIWQDFLNGILKRINPLTIEANTVVCKLAPDKELISLIATDEILRRYILKAENYRILIESAHINKVKKRLGELGYFIGNM